MAVPNAVLGEHRVGAILERRAQLRERHPVAQRVAADPATRDRDIGLGQQIGPQQLGQGAGVDRVGLDPGRSDRAEGVRASVCEAGATGFMSVGQSVCEVDLEASKCCGPVVGGPPFRFGSLDGEIDELGSGLLIREVAAGLDRRSDLAGELFDAVGGVDGSAQLGG